MGSISFGASRSSAFVAFLVLSFSAAAVPPSAPSARLIDIEYPAEGADFEWIGSRTEFIAVFSAELPALARVLSDYPSYPSFVPNLAGTTVISSGDGVAVIRQDSRFAAFGRRFETRYDLEMRRDDSGMPGTWILAWNLVGSDGKVRESRGSWTLEDVGSPDAPATRVTHRNFCLVRKTFPFQDRIMRTFAESSMSRYLLTVYAEARARGGGPLASAER